MTSPRLARVQELLSRTAHPGGAYPVLSVVARTPDGAERRVLGEVLARSSLAPVWDAWQSGSAEARAGALTAFEPSFAPVHLLTADLWLRDADPRSEPFPGLRSELCRRDPRLAEAYTSLLAYLVGEYDSVSEQSSHHQGFHFSATAADALFTSPEVKLCFARACAAWGNVAVGALPQAEAAELALHHTAHGTGASLRGDRFAALEWPEVLAWLSLWGPRDDAVPSKLRRALNLRRLEVSGDVVAQLAAEPGALSTLPLHALSLRLDTRRGGPSIAALLEAVPALDELALQLKEGATDSAAGDLSALPLPRALTSLALSGVGFVPDSVRSLAGLRVLSIRGWRLQAIPASIVSLASLESLSIDPVMVLPSLPDGLEQLQALRTLRLGHLATAEIPAALFRMPWLRSLTLVSSNRWPPEEQQRLQDALPQTTVSIGFTGGAGTAKPPGP